MRIRWRDVGLDHVRSEIEYMLTQVSRQRNEILKLQRANISTASAELLLTRMLVKIDELCDERGRLNAGLPKPLRCWEDAAGEILQRRSRPATFHQGTSAGPLLSDARGLVLPTRRGNHAMDQYAEKAMCNRDYFLNKPYGTGGSNDIDIP